MPTLDVTYLGPGQYVGISEEPRGEASLSNVNGLNNQMEMPWLGA